ncbi:MAG TPA: protein kinase, partial [Acidobacteriota bacterium]|nr:protein kinase [Acidobacteriota bacterium]
MPELEEDLYVHVLLIESEQDTVSLVTLCLSEIKECRLRVFGNIAHALLSVQEREPDLILYSHNHEDKDSLLILTAIHQKHPSCYLIVSLPESDSHLMDAYMRAGARDCVIKDKKYVQGLVTAVKSALIYIAERESIVLPLFSRADQFAMDENLPDMVFLIDRDGKILHVNRAISDFLGYEQRDVIHKSFMDLLGTVAQGVFNDYLQRIEYSQNFRGPVTVKNSAGNEEQFEINCTCLEDMIYGVLRRDSSWEAVAEMIDAVGTEESAALLEEEAEELEGREDVIPGRLGPYRVVTLLGAGAMGRVYKGYDEQLDRYVAIKVIGSSLAADSEYLNRFHHEAKILASIIHPNIALIYHYGDTDGPPFFCMEFMPGGSLEEVLQKEGHIDPETAVSYAMQVALGLAEAAKKGVVHLDIKPSNLMLAENDRVKIVDFGLAKTGRDLESGGAGLVGTPHYIAPEQVQGNPVDFRADIYSLGVTLFRMLYGSMPFPGDTILEILNKQLHGEMPSRESLSPEVPPVFYDIVRRMIAREPARRYPSYAELIQDLEGARRSSHEPVPRLEIPGLPVAILMRGLLYDQPFAEILGEIIRRDLSGRLTLSWIDLRKNIHFKNGKIVAV